MPIQETVGLLKGVTSISSETAEEFRHGRTNISDEEIKTFDVKLQQRCVNYTTFDIVVKN